MWVRLRGERGRVVPLVVVMILLVGVALVGLARLGAALDDAAQARTAADAAALAGAVGGESAAAEMAAANGGNLESYIRRGAVVEVTVRVERSRATARAEVRIDWRRGAATQAARAG